MAIRERMKVKPYSLRDYSIDALNVIRERMTNLKVDSVGDGMSLNQILVHIEKTGKAPFAEPSYGAKWSALSRKRKRGLLLLWLYYIAEKEKLDMTAVLAHRLLQGLAGTSMANHVLLEAFSQSDRTAANKSSDWERLDDITDKYRGRVMASLLRNKEKMAIIKNKLWNIEKAREEA